MTQPASQNLRIVLVETSHPGNIGAAARAMKTMGLSELYLVNPQRYPSVEATARSAGADDVLSNAKVVASLPEALVGCVEVYGTSTRLRANRWPIVDPQTAAQQMFEYASQGVVACVFGREQSGLSNEELGYCHTLVHIPVNPAYQSLNLASAVQIIAYELHRKLGITPRQESSQKRGESRALAEEVERFYTHLEQTLINIDFLDPANPRHMMPRLRRLFNRAKLTRVETQILRGILTAINEQGSRSSG